MHINNYIGAFICVCALGFALIYLQGELNLDPCPLCVVDRIILVLMALFFLLAEIPTSKSKIRKSLAITNVLLSGLGIFFASRHVYIQNQPAAEIADCGAGFWYMLDHFPILDTLKFVLEGSGECGKISWTFLNLSIPIWTLMLFIILSFFTIIEIRTAFRSKNTAK